MTWNVHRCRGRDGRVDPERTAHVLTGLLSDSPADLVVLTEADGEQPPYAALLDVQRVLNATGLSTVHSDASLRWGEASSGFLGTVVLHSHRIDITSGQVLDLPGVYPRGATALACRSGGQEFRVVAAHLSLGQAFRLAQMRAVGQFLARSRNLPAMLIGDMNEWRPWGGFAFGERVAHLAFAGSARRSFPAAFPMLPLDRIMVTAPFQVRNAQVVTSAELRETSDHLPLRATVMMD
ncbi:MAG: endonuclease/exonuclease/phosphatase family protein [Pseudomonadota bacterium]